MKEYRVCHREHGSEHTSAVKFRDWGGRQNWQGNATDEEREQAAFEWLDEHRRFSRIFYGIKECDMWLEEREVDAWHEVFADGGTVSETCIRPAEEGFVRCRDCKRFSLDNSDHDYRSGWWCHRWNTDMVKPDGFCAWGERRDA